MRLAILFLVPVLFAAENPKLPEPFQSIWDLASAAPPEFASDALLRMVESGKLADKKARVRLTEQAFQLASVAKLPVRMVGVSGTTTDTASGSMSQAYALGLDILSLQSRAVRDMLPLDPAKARDLFGQIIKPTLAPLTCDDALVYEPSEYYLALIAVVNGAFTPQEKAKDAHFNLLLDAAGRASSPSEIAPLTSAIQSAAVTETQRAILSARLGALPEGLRTNKGHACDSGPKLDRYWQSPTAKQLLDAGKNLRYLLNGRPLADADRSTPEWQEALADYLNLMAGWTQDQSESNAVFYHEKCLVYTSLLDLVPPGPQSDKILADYIDFVGNAGLYQQSPAEWFSEPNSVLDRSQAIAGQHYKVLDAFQHSGNPVLMLTVALEKAFHRT
jgi:hypothetical protein